MVMRKAASMIELILAIVIIGIVVTGMPRILSLSDKNDMYSLQQQAIQAAQTRINLVLTYDWDENSTDSVNNMTRILDVSDGDSDLNRTKFPIRIGQQKKGERRRFFNDTTFAHAIDNTHNTDIDYFDSKTTTFKNVASVASGGLLNRILKDYKLTTSIGYISDTADYSKENLSFNLGTTLITNPKTTNIKIVEVKAQGGDIKPIVLRAYSFNIGQSRVESRIFK